MMEKVVILSFSGRNNGNCRHITDIIEQYHGNVQYFCINDRFKPCNGCDYECLKPGLQCPGFDETQKEVFDAILGADMVYYLIPNFCGFPAASFCAFNERSVGYFNGDRGIMGQYLSVKKRFIIVSNSENAVFAAAVRQQTKDEPDVLYLKTSKYRKQSLAGDLMESEEARADLMAFLNAVAI